MKTTFTILSAILSAVVFTSADAAGTSRNLGRKKKTGKTDPSSDDPSTSDDKDTRKLNLNIINQAFQQPFGAFFVMVHNDEAPLLYKRGEKASHELARLAEDGDPGPLIDYYKHKDGVYDVYAFDKHAPYFLGDTPVITVEVPEGYYVTIASMAINTNDCFVSINGAKLEAGQVWDLPGLDAGTEENNERCSSIPGPACKHIDNRNQRDGNGEGYVHVHPLWNWSRPVAVGL